MIMTLITLSSNNRIVMMLHLLVFECEIKGLLA